MESLIWPILLLAAGLGLLTLELFVPSAGVLSIGAALCVLAAIFVGFTTSLPVGVSILGVTVVLIPAVLAAAVRFWPHTPIGRLVLLHRPESPDDVLPDSEEYRGLKPLIGRYGTTSTKMLPGGIVVVDGQSYDALSDGMAIDAECAVQIVDVRTNRLIVRPVAELPPEATKPPESGDDVLSQPIDSLGLDGFEEPLG